MASNETSSSLPPSRPRIAKSQSRKALYPAEYMAWCNMRCRCGNPKHRDFKYYGGRGITVDPVWDDFLVFYAEVGKRPTKNHSIDRIDNARGYEPGNVRWTTRNVQQRNRRNNRVIRFGGLSLCLAQWERRTGLPVRSRVNNGWDPDRALTEPVHNTGQRGARD